MTAKLNDEAYVEALAPRAALNQHAFCLRVNRWRLGRPADLGALPLRHLVLAVCLLLGGATAPATAQSASDSWRVTVAPYLMAAGLSGTVGARSFETDIDVSASDIFSHLKFGVMSVVAVRKGAWGFGADVIYVALGANPEQPPADVGFNQTAGGSDGSRLLARPRT